MNPSVNIKISCVNGNTRGEVKGEILVSIPIRGARGSGVGDQALDSLKKKKKVTNSMKIGTI